jgi:hypothetical protein
MNIKNKLIKPLMALLLITSLVTVPQGDDDPPGSNSPIVTESNEASK